MCGCKKSFFGKYKVFIKGGKEKIKINPIEKAKEFENAGIGELIVNSIDNDCMMRGYDNKLVRMILIN